MRLGSQAQMAECRDQQKGAEGNHGSNQPADYWV
jgi:hypothetical protein